MDAWEKTFFEKAPEKLKTYFQSIARGRIPTQAPLIDFFEVSLSSTIIRTFCTRRGLWTMLDKEWTRQLATWIGTRKVLEIMAGGGWLARTLHEHHVNIIATDDYSWKQKKQETYGHTNLPKWTERFVRKMDAIKAIQKIPADILLISWPPHEDRIIVNACDSWGTKRPIIYIGEHDGATACKEFDDRFQLATSKRIPKIPLPQWWGLHDRIYIGHWTMAKKKND